MICPHSKWRVRALQQMNNLTFLQNFVPVQSSLCALPCELPQLHAPLGGAVGAAEVQARVGAAFWGFPCAVWLCEVAAVPGTGGDHGFARDAGARTLYQPRVGACPGSQGLLLSSTQLLPCRKPARLLLCLLEEETPNLMRNHLAGASAGMALPRMLAGKVAWSPRFPGDSAQAL